MKIDGIEVATGDCVCIPLPGHLKLLPWYKKLLVKAGWIKPPPNGIYKVTEVAE